MKMKKEDLLDTEIVRGLGFKVHLVDGDRKYNYKDSDSTCAITTIARVMDITWDEAYNGLSELGFKKHRSMVIEENIIDYLKLNAKCITIFTMPKYYNEGAAQYLLRVGALEEDEKSIFLVFTNGHCFPVIAGTIYDFSTNYIDGGMCSPCSIYLMKTELGPGEDVDELYAKIKKKSKCRVKDYIVNFLPLKDKFKNFNPRPDKSKSQIIFSDSVIRAFSKILNKNYMEMQAYFYYTAVTLSAVMTTVSVVKSVARNYDMTFYQENKLPSLYAFLNANQTGKYVVIIDLQHTVDITNYYYIPVIDGVLYDDTFKHYGTILGKPVVGYFKEFQ